MGELIPSAGKGVRKLVKVFVETTRNLFISRVFAESEVGGEHDGLVRLLGEVRVGHGAGAGIALGLPLLGSRRALGKLPLVAKEVVEIAIAPLRRRVGPRSF